MTPAELFAVVVSDRPNGQLLTELIPISFAKELIEKPKVIWYTGNGSGVACSCRKRESQHPAPYLVEPSLSVF
jgi:hypothetical protein